MNAFSLTLTSDFGVTTASNGTLESSLARNSI